MHPVIRLSCLMAIALLLPWWPAEVLYAFAAVLLVVAAARPQAGRSVLLALRRTRWLLLSVVLLYGWFTPGEAFIPALSWMSPTEAGVVLALHRGLVIIAMITLVVLFIHGIPKPELSAALRAMTSLAGSPGRRFADRVALMLDTLPAAEQAVREAMRGEHSFADRAAALIAGVENSAAAMPVLPRTVILPPPRWQWLVPAGLLGTAALMVFGLEQ